MIKYEKSKKYSASHTNHKHRETNQKDFDNGKYIVIKHHNTSAEIENSTYMIKVSYFRGEI